MDARTFFYAVSKMREAQKHYFKTRSPIALRAARAAEREIDAEIERTREYLRQQEAIRLAQLGNQE